LEAISLLGVAFSAKGEAKGEAKGGAKGEQKAPVQIGIFFTTSADPVFRAAVAHVFPFASSQSWAMP